MRPPDLPGGNASVHGPPCARYSRFNEAAGFTRRKPELGAAVAEELLGASMRPPDLPGGNSLLKVIECYHYGRFNEAAGFTRRKQDHNE